ncbi:hypothetical protein [Dyadobacter frigoris]|uniref:Uncharacterized protein n=1 Tax=Dyadobacter frigoris TaxID=2576211 RepID=A0A4U6D8S6_9BACT|nr:hypothetical protein [Dyadobacter frigoris]TKT92667.1 hypothetical protein FDK13_07580 [Dyadobacter frigoris]
MSLTDDLGFTEVGISRLTEKLIEEFIEFSIELSDEEVLESETVNGLLLLIWSKIPTESKEHTAFSEHLLTHEGLIDMFSEEASKTSEIRRIHRQQKKTNENHE